MSFHKKLPQFSNIDTKVLETHYIVKHILVQF